MASLLENWFYVLISSLNKKKLKLYFCWIQEAPTSEKYVLTFRDYKQMETDFFLIRRQKLAMYYITK